jgi:phage host-nuclease inhibitor protein Gam
MLFDSLARSEISLAAKDAKFEKRIADIKAAYSAETDELRSTIAEQAKALAAYIMCHQDAFVDPRKVKSSFGTFGLQAVNSVEVTDEEACIASVLRRKLDNCYKQTTKLLRDGLRKELEAGTNIPGCKLNDGDTATYSVDKTLIAAAKKEAVL